MPSFNYRVDVQVTDRLDTKALGQDTFTLLVAPNFPVRISRTAAGSVPVNQLNKRVTSAALEVSVNPQPQPGPARVVRVKLGAQFNLPPGAGENDPGGVEVGQDVTAMMTLGKPMTVIDASSGSEGRRRFIVQVTVTQVPVE
jgi:hypothetical protein